MIIERIKNIHLASDHAGLVHKEGIKQWLQNSIYQVTDHGAEKPHPLDDFTDFVSKAVGEVSKSPEESCAIIFGGSGQGEAMLANRYPNVRATVFYGGDKEIIRLSRLHNDANILSFGSRFISIEEIKDCILLWLSTNVSEEEKYKRRNQKIDELAKDFYKKL